MASIFSGVDRYRKWKRDELRRKEQFIRVREESIAEGREEGRGEGREEGRASALADVRTLLVERGIDPDDILPPE